MNFDFDYVTTAADETLNSISVDWKLVCIIAGAVIISAVICCLIIILVKKARKPKLYVGDGNIFCRRCLNEYDSGLMKCPYCKTKRF